jgi:uncharacterized membrane protein YfcA
MTTSQIVILLVTGIIAGLASGTLGIGGAIVVIPMLTFFLGMNQQQAQGTSLIVMSFPVFLLSAWNYYRHGYANFKFALIIVVAFIIGSFIGSSISVYLPEKVLRKIFGVFLVFIGVRMFLK